MIDGKIIFAPHNADGVGVFDPSDNSFVLVDISSTVSDDWKFSGAATASDGKIIFAPSHADGVGVFDPSDNSFVLVGNFPNDEYKFDGVVTASNGKIILVPSSAAGAVESSPSDNSFELIVASYSVSNIAKFSGAGERRQDHLRAE